jgi:4-carboxymuconolactone decarboxylase
LTDEEGLGEHVRNERKQKMKLFAAAVASFSVVMASSAQGQQLKPDQGSGPMPRVDDIREVAPGLDRYTQDTLMGDVWKRPDLSVRDRSIVTLGALIARNQTVEVPYYLNLALDSGVKPGEISEIITHLAFYSGRGNAMSAVAVARDVFSKRKIGADQLPPASGRLLPLDEAGETQRASRVEQDFGSVAPGVVQYTRDLLFKDLWLRAALAPRDRSLITVSALIASGQVAQIPYHLNRAMDNGLTKTQASEVLTHLAFYAGWPNVFSALPVAKGVFEQRPR